ncbi:hypothetical protein ACKS0A_03378 [Histoplasma ohiense]
MSCGLVAVATAVVSVRPIMHLIFSLRLYEQTYAKGNHTVGLEDRPRWLQLAQLLSSFQTERSCASDY